MKPHFGQMFEAASFDPSFPGDGPPRRKGFRTGRRIFQPGTAGRPVVAPGSIDRWMSFELGRLNAGLVVEKKSLARLLAEPDPACRTREGDAHPFDRAALDQLASVLNRDEAEKLRLPLTLIVSGDSEDSAYLTDELGAKALRAIEKFDRAFPFRDGRMALPHSLAIDLVRRHGGALQLAFA